jgi:2-polyprenyl-3-methyl-5-hydroxy-6-metoxy-1,4-benzoquinol methylase
VAENVRCNLCNGNDIRQKLVARDEFWMIGEKFYIVQCRKCNLAFLNPRPSQEEITNYYPDDYYVDAKEWNIQRTNVKELQNRLDYVAKHYGPKSPGKLLDIGIFNGAFVSFSLSAGWDAYGLDPSPKAISLARQIVPHERLFHGYAESPPFPPSTFDAVSMWEVLEHTMDPLDVLKTVSNMVSPQGLIVMSVPNFTSLESRLFGKYWSGLDVPRHLYHFTPATLDKMLKNAELDIVYLKTVNASQILEFADPITYGRESIRNLLINLKLYPERKRISDQELEEFNISEDSHLKRRKWKKTLFRAVETPLLWIINSISAATASNNTIIAVARKV